MTVALFWNMKSGWGSTCDSCSPKATVSPPLLIFVCVSGLGALVSMSDICYALYWSFLSIFIAVKSRAGLCASYGILGGG